MFARSTTVRGDPAAIDRGITEVRDSVMPAVQGMDGCVGISMLVDRESGRCIVTTAWSDEEALTGSRERVRDLRMRATSALGAGEPEIREYEIAVVHRERPVPEAACARVTWLKVSPSNMDRQIDVFRERVLPALQELDGFCSASLLVDRESGHAAGAVMYESRATLEASREATKAIRSGALGAVGAERIDVAEFDAVLAHLRVPERV